MQQNSHAAALQTGMPFRQRADDSHVTASQFNALQLRDLESRTGICQGTTSLPESLPRILDPQLQRLRLRGTDLRRLSPWPTQWQLTHQRQPGECSFGREAYNCCLGCCLLL